MYKAKRMISVKNKKNRKGRRVLPYILTGLLVLMIAAGVYIYFENNRVDVSRYKVAVRNLPESFENFRIVQISDFHNTMLGSENCLIVDAVKNKT